MRCYKEKEYIIFEFENGKRATYNMNTGETIGKKGNRVNSLCSALAGQSIQSVLDSFVDKKYAAFLKEIWDRKTPRSYVYYKSGSRVTNLGTLLKYANEYKAYEQYVLAGLPADINITTPLKEVPKGLLKLCRMHNKTLNDKVIKEYAAMPNAYQVAFNMEFEMIQKHKLWDILSALVPYEQNQNYWYHRDYSHLLLTDRKYNLQALLRYVDNLAVFEGIDADVCIITEIGDYANMMWRISEKYEKYPSYFLSTHMIAARNYDRLKHQFDEQNFAKRRKPEYEMTYKDFVFIYPNCTQDIKDEAVQQSNCVASYIERVINGGCHIMFLRRKANPDQSLVTLEVRNGKIVQARQAYNRAVSEDQQEAINAFNKKFAKEDD